MEGQRMNLVIELNSEGRIWVSALDGTVLEEAWIPGPDEQAAVLRQSSLCRLEEQYAPGHWASTTLDPQEIAGQLWVEASEAGGTHAQGETP
jgi:hypothetical protein